MPEIGINAVASSGNCQLAYSGQRKYDIVLSRSPTHANGRLLDHVVQ